MNREMLLTLAEIRQGITHKMELKDGAHMIFKKLGDDHFKLTMQKQGEKAKEFDLNGDGLLKMFQKFAEANVAYNRHSTT